MKSVDGNTKEAIAKIKELDTAEEILAFIEGESRSTITKAAEAKVAKLSGLEEAEVVDEKGGVQVLLDNSSNVLRVEAGGKTVLSLAIDSGKDLQINGMNGNTASFPLKDGIVLFEG